MGITIDFIRFLDEILFFVKQNGKNQKCSIYLYRFLKPLQLIANTMLKNRLILLKSNYENAEIKAKNRKIT